LRLPSNSKRDGRSTHTHSVVVARQNNNMAGQIGKRRVRRRKAALRALGHHAQCPLWVKSGHSGDHPEMSVYLLRADMRSTGTVGQTDRADSKRRPEQACDHDVVAGPKKNRHPGGGLVRARHKNLYPEPPSSPVAASRTSTAMRYAGGIAARTPPDHMRGKGHMEHRPGRVAERGFSEKAPPCYPQNIQNLVLRVLRVPYRELF
jgi:hypothetical protein